jgi:hypothetical protein
MVDAAQPKPGLYMKQVASQLAVSYHPTASPR